jgi:hypothetical protein
MARPPAVDKVVAGVLTATAFLVLLRLLLSIWYWPFG